MALKVSKRWSALSAGVQKLYGEESVYFETVETSSISQHWIMSSPDLGAGEGILQSYMAGTVIFEGGNSTEVRPCAVLMDLAQGGSLQGLVEQMHWKMQKPKKRRTVAAQAELVHHLLKKVLTSLDRLHTEGWAHLDLKLGNVVSREKQDLAALLQSDYDADKLQPLLIDFGSAVYLGRAKHKPGVRSIYTVSYASPELQHWKIVSRKADVWSVGVLLLSLRTGSPPSMKHTKCPAPMHKADPDSLTCADTHAAVLRNLRKQANFQDMTEREWDFVKQALTFDWHERPSAGELLNSDYMVYGP
jgi:serine/threonine protein kinase